MFIVANLVNALAVCLDIVVTALWWLIIIRAVISWVNPDPYNPIVQFIYKATEPILSPFRKIFPIYNLGIDISPIFAILALMLARHFIIRTLFDLSVKLR